MADHDNQEVANNDDRVILGPDGVMRTFQEWAGKENRRRRIQIRRNKSLETGWPRPFYQRLDVGDDANAGCRVPVVGVLTAIGMRQRMEDRVSIKFNLCAPAINRCRPVHFFGVFDGHGGSHVAKICEGRMHEILEGEIMRAEYLVPSRSNTHGVAESRAPVPPQPRLTTNEIVLQEAWRRVFIRAFEKIETVALNTCSCGSTSFDCNCNRGALAVSGSTAVTMVLTNEHIVVANCGDSRAILCRGGRVVPLSVDHKPERRDEKARIEALGGKVFGDDLPRVLGILSTSRAIGPRFLKPYVISEPDITFTRKDPDDEFVILASDGLWDVISSEMACKVTLQCLKEPQAEASGSQHRMSNIPGTHFRSRSASAAALLTSLAVAKKTGDNVSVVVVDLKRFEL